MAAEDRICVQKIPGASITGMCAGSSSTDLQQLAQYQRLLLRTILLGMALFPIWAVAAFFSQVFLIITTTAQEILYLRIVQFSAPLCFGLVVAWRIYQVGAKLYSFGIALLLEACVMLPGINLGALLIVNSDANRILKRHGFKIGLLGAKSCSAPASDTAIKAL